MLTSSTGKIKCLKIIKYDRLFQNEKDSLRSYCLRKYQDETPLNTLASSIRRWLKFAKPKKKISNLIYDIINHLKKEGIHTEGIFRLPSNFAATNKLTNHIINNESIDLSCFDVLTIANAFKKYIREELDGLIPEEVAYTLEKNIKNNNPLKNIEYFPFTLEEDKRKLLIEVFSLFKEIDKYSKVNRMNINNILLIVPPTIFPKAVQRNIKEFLPFVDILKEIYRLDYENVPNIFIDK
ncbi:hypothetical protein H312_00551 [Anncaliia algerae PRA339]|uniref:Rho-GAP domain-containing protein n=1 Tax=Anncaliia algerae PRA339 TaxID=1288291 RepID=A0A059F496_9MICR|nr:hypothetical protein H312_00551 [Anncaliia algerae PRA339]